MLQGSHFITKIEFFTDLNSKTIKLLQSGARNLSARLTNKNVKKRLHHIKVGRDKMLNPRAEDFHRHLGAIQQCGAMHNRDGSATNGRLIKLREHFLEFAPQFNFNDFADLIKGHDWTGVETATKFVGQFIPKEARRGGDDLSELYEGATDALEGFAQGSTECRDIDRTRARASKLTNGDRQ